MQPKILLVDDREDNLLSIGAILEPSGYKLYKAMSGKEALKILLEETDFAIILMDVKMPVLNGFETATLIYERERLKSIPIIFITANNYGDENVFKGYQAGGIDYILKPINPDVLRVKVSVFVNLYKKNHLLLEQEQKLVAINKILGNEIQDRKVSEERVKAVNSKLAEKISDLESTHKDLKQLTFDSASELSKSVKEILVNCDKLLNKSPEDSKIILKIRKAAEHVQNATQDILSFSETPVEQ